MLKEFTSHRRQSSVFAQKRIGMPAMRKYTLVSSANGLLYTLRRLITSDRPRSTCSERELTFNESTSLSAAFLRAFGIRCPRDSFSGETACAEAMIVTKPDIVIRFGVIVLRDRMNRTDDRNTPMVTCDGSAIYISPWCLKIFLTLPPAKSSRRLSSRAVPPLPFAVSVRGQMLPAFLSKSGTFRNASESRCAL